MNKAIFFIILLSLFQTVHSQIVIDSLKGELIAEHNFYRQVLNVHSLHWSDTLAEKAKEQAILICKNPNNYPHNLEYGMNIYRSTNKPTAKEVLYFWTKEQRYYNGKPQSESNKKFPHYAQIIWKQTRTFGCAIDSTKGHLYIIVCLYSPKLQIEK